MGNGKAQNGLGAAASAKKVAGTPAVDLTDDAILGAAIAGEKSPEELVAEEAKAEEEFISTPEDAVSNPLVPAEPSAEGEGENRLEGAIGSGDLGADYPEANPEPVSNEGNALANAETEAPVAETTATEVDADTSASAAPVAGPTVADVAAQADATAKKKSKKGLIITLIIVFLLLIGGGVGFFVWFMIHESSENMVQDALAKTISAENLQTTATIETTANGQKVNITLDSVMAGEDLSGSGKIKTTYGDKDIEIGYSSVYSKDGAVYFKIDGLKDTLKNSGLIDSVATENGLGAMLSVFSEIIDATVEAVEGNWYKITPSELKAMSGDNGISCVLENLNGVFSADTKKAMAEAYKKHQFLKIDSSKAVEEKNGIKYISATTDKNIAKEFVKEIKDTDGFKRLQACSVVSDETKEEDTEEASDVEVVLGIKSWSHELVEIKAVSKSASGSEDTATTTIKLSYDKKEVAVPNDAKTIEGLITDVMESLEASMTKEIDDACELEYGAYGRTYVELCKKSAKEQMGDYDLSSLLNGLNFGNSSSI